MTSMVGWLPECTAPRDGSKFKARFFKSKAPWEYGPVQYRDDVAEYWPREIDGQRFAWKTSDGWYYANHMLAGWQPGA